MSETKMFNKVVVDNFESMLKEVDEEVRQMADKRKIMINTLKEMLKIWANVTVKWNNIKFTHTNRIRFGSNFVLKFGDPHLYEEFYEGTYKVNFENLSNQELKNLIGKIPIELNKVFKEIFLQEKTKK